VIEISRHFPREKRDVFLGMEASESAFKRSSSGNYQVVHFACHGILNDQSPLRSALVLSPDAEQGEDGFVQMREILDLKMNSELVVLSACQSGSGTLEKGEGLVGLTRTFFHAGAFSVLSSLWSVNDRSTARLMNDFYSGLVQGQDKGAALRLAKLKMLSSTQSHPFYWAGFVLNGDPGPVRFRTETGRRVSRDLLRTL
jgi:CHAT domain-containing protein